jgi:large subunit ribosomal protein L9
MAETKAKAKKPKREKPKKSAEAAAKARFPKITKKRNQVPRGEHGGMKLLLIEDIAHVGRQGDVVEVKPGFGRNFLIPQGLATYVTPATLARIEAHKAKVEALRLARIAELKKLAKTLEAHSITIEANANEEGHLYGSVTAVDIVRAVEKEKLTVAENQIKLEGPIKELGLYHVKVVLDEGVETDLKVWVVPTSNKPD